MSNKRIDRKTAQRYRLVYRSQEDPLIHDAEAPTGVFVEIEKKEKREPRIQTLQDLADDIESYGPRRENEGEAAMYGIAFDDSTYDYMQHLREIGTVNDGSAVFIASNDSNNVTRRREKQQNIQFKEDETKRRDVLPDIVRPSSATLIRTYQDQQSVPDEISGLQPDMDPALREVLEALEDDEYIDAEDDDIFKRILKDDESYVSGNDDNLIGEDDEELEDQTDWEREFRKFKIAESNSKALDSDDDFHEDDISEVLGFLGRNSKSNRRTAKTSTTGFSMSSSAMFRNEGLSLLDDRFDQIERLYEEDDYDIDITKEANDNSCNDSKAELKSSSFNAIMDEFLDTYKVVGKRVVHEKIDQDTSRISRQPNQTAVNSRALPKLTQNQKKYARGLEQLNQVKQQLGKPQGPLAAKYGLK
ncbi:Low temperature viability protein-domain-containing protein [Dipodascopsis uninucleata]